MVAAESMPCTPSASTVACAVSSAPGSNVGSSSPWRPRPLSPVRMPRTAPSVTSSALGVGLGQHHHAELFGPLRHEAREPREREHVVALVVHGRGHDREPRRARAREQVHGLALDRAVARHLLQRHARGTAPAAARAARRRPRADARRPCAPCRRARSASRRAAPRPPGRPRAAARAGSRRQARPARRRRSRRRPRAARRPAPPGAAMTSDAANGGGYAAGDDRHRGHRTQPDRRGRYSGSRSGQVTLAASATWRTAPRLVSAAMPIDLRSDTVTRPSPAMREAMALGPRGRRRLRRGRDRQRARAQGRGAVRARGRGLRARRARWPIRSAIGIWAGQGDEVYAHATRTS